MGNTGYTRWTLQGLSGRKAGHLKEVGLGWINGGRKDHGFGWGKIRGGGLCICLCDVCPPSKGRFKKGFKCKSFNTTVCSLR